jgi:hypothetical protein
MIDVDIFLYKLDLLREYMHARIDKTSAGLCVNARALPMVSPDILRDIAATGAILVQQGPVSRPATFAEFVANRVVNG